MDPLEVQRNLDEGCYLSTCFVDRKHAKPRLITNFKRVSQHWDSPGGKMESLQEFALGIGQGDRLLSFDLKYGYRAVALHKEMQKYFMFRHSGKVYCTMTLPFGWNVSPYWFIQVMKPVQLCKLQGGYELRSSLGCSRTWTIIC